jgi:hypothetical protein
MSVILHGRSAVVPATVPMDIDVRAPRDRSRYLELMTYWDRPVVDLLSRELVRCLCLVDPYTCAMRPCVSRHLKPGMPRLCGCRVMCRTHDVVEPNASWMLYRTASGEKAPPQPIPVPKCSCEVRCPYHGEEATKERRLHCFEMEEVTNLTGDAAFNLVEGQLAKKQEKVKHEPKKLKKKEPKKQKDPDPWWETLFNGNLRCLLPHHPAVRTARCTTLMCLLPLDLLSELWCFMNSHYGPALDPAMRPGDVLDRGQDVHWRCGRGELSWRCHAPGQHVNSSGCMHPTVRCVGRVPKHTKHDHVPVRTSWDQDDVCLPVRPVKRFPFSLGEWSVPGGPVGEASQVPLRVPAANFSRCWWRFEKEELPLWIRSLDLSVKSTFVVINWGPPSKTMRRSIYVEVDWLFNSVCCYCGRLALLWAKWVPFNITRTLCTCTFPLLTGRCMRCGLLVDLCPCLIDVAESYH